MSRKPDTYEVRLHSRRAPYRRAGVGFASTRTPVVIPADDLTDGQLDRLSADPVITIEVIDKATGDVVALQTEGGAVIGIASAEGETIGATGGETVAPVPGAASGDAAAPEAAAGGETGGGQAGAGSVPPAPATPASTTQSADQAAALASDGTAAPKPATTKPPRKAKR